MLGSLKRTWSLWPEISRSSCLWVWSKSNPPNILFPTYLAVHVRSTITVLCFPFCMGMNWSTERIWLAWDPRVTGNDGNKGWLPRLLAQLTLYQTTGMSLLRPHSAPWKGGPLAWEDEGTRRLQRTREDQRLPGRPGEHSEYSLENVASYHLTGFKGIYSECWGTSCLQQ